MQLPEANYSKERLEHFFRDLGSNLYSFNIIKISYLDKKQGRITLTTLDQLHATIVMNIPKHRDRVQITFEYKRKQNSKNMSKGTIFLGITADTSKVAIEGGTRRTQEEDSEKIISISSKYERQISNAVGKVLFAYFIPALLLLLNYLFPKTIFPGSMPITVLTAFISASLFLFFHFRPHSFITKENWDSFQIFPEWWKSSILIILVVICSFLVTQIPILLGRDAEIVEQSPILQLEILRKIVTPELLQKLETLRNTAKLYDSATDEMQKNIASKAIATSINDILSSGKFIDYPIGKLNLFLSSASSLNKSNYLHEPMLLLSIINVENEKASLSYKPHVFDTTFGHAHFLGVYDWLNEPIIKDKYGKVWTRKSFVTAVSSEEKGEISDEDKNNLHRLKYYPDKTVMFQLGDQKPIVHANSVENESTRAVAEELIRSMEKIQLELSSHPESTKQGLIK